MRTGIGAIKDQIERVTPSWMYEQPWSVVERYVPIIAKRDPDPRAGIRFTIVCSCGSPAFAWYDEDGVYHIESHSDGLMGSDVPCYGTWY
ncbi:hypothetical protein KHO57_gp054 [Mycobacterium phage Phabba]|uniref:Uncharacterized protein n=1 Tax=Mycobacterium phage Phabba TaxID=2027899 RepID=A0A249XSB8_9CAUD|nr:hypothetical protein KHO57_gp054 [Mycobacterium phage Phabba]ASZ74629.1 hypothetical protein SEA_PHABBA_54 [Mycobacterium phage Phabba]